VAITTAKINAVLRGITQSFDNGVRTGSPLYPQICTIVPSNSRDEKYGWIGDVPDMKEFLGERTFDQLRAFDYEIANRSFEQSLGVDRYDIEDDRYSHYSNIAEGLGRKAVRHPDELMVSLLLTGEQFKTDKGSYFMPRAITADLLSDLHLLVPLSLWEVASQAMQQMIVAQGGVAVDNVLLAKAQVHPILGLGAEGGGSDAKFQLLYTGGTVKPFIFQQRKSLIRQVKGLTDIEDKMVKFMTEVRYNVGFGLWQHAMLCEFN